MAVAVAPAVAPAVASALAKVEARARGTVADAPVVFLPLGMAQGASSGVTLRRLRSLQLLRLLLLLPFALFGVDLRRRHGTIRRERPLSVGCDPLSLTQLSDIAPVHEHSTSVRQAAPRAHLPTLTEATTRALPKLRAGYGPHRSSLRHVD